MKNMEDTYSQDIHPLVERITLVCQQVGMPMFMTFQENKEAFRTSFINNDSSGLTKLRMHQFVHQTWSFDEFMKKVIEDARENGHNSLYLKAMGILEKPE